MQIPAALVICAVTLGVEVVGENPSVHLAGRGGAREGGVQGWRPIGVESLFSMCTRHDSAGLL